MRDRSYEWLKDATLFGLISDKSAEIRGSEYWKNCQFSIRNWPFSAFLFVCFVCKVADDDITCMRKGYFRTRSMSARRPVWRISNLSNIWT